MGINSEGCRELTSQAPLKPGETHCPFCYGFGARPVNKQISNTGTKPEKCYKCSGTGKTKLRCSYDF